MAGTLTALTPRARQIVEAAREILESEGPDALSMRRVGAQLGIRAASLYEHLRDKQALEAALISVGFEESAELFTRAVDGAADPVAALAKAYRDFARRQPHLYLLMSGRPLRRDLLSPGVEEAAARPLIEAVGGDVDLARAVWAFLHGMVVLELHERFAPGADLDAAWRTGLAAFHA
ncbi:TetR/AcrR family transcriptional regulator [Hamadaea tsunoensis]|uniref:TetR/AcrR family transcriptional regulator n=1 Tax=Hamadaea tsunoensis TaxID=53368 RepID=UPI0004044AEC|nr:TetR/AcrR family transcriptional regulator [Hamadaea tsunoensis]